MALELPPISINFKNFSVSFPERTLKAGEILGIFGKSGAGKTSYLKRIRELCAPNDVHYLSQFDGLLEEITIRQNIELGLVATGANNSIIHNWEKHHTHLLDDFEVHPHLDKYPRAMSGGQRKRSEIVRCLIMNPNVLLLDEPFNGIGHIFEAICTRELLHRSQHSNGVTIVVSHDFDLLTTFCSNILLVDDQGVIETINVHDHSWHPNSLRTAYTLAVDNVILPNEQSHLRFKSTTLFDADKGIGFWARNATWNTTEDITITFSKDAIRSVRSAPRKGITYSFVEVHIPHQEHTALLVGQGKPTLDDATVQLGVHEAWPLGV